MKHLVFAIAVIFSGQSLQAEVVVRSGEHATFSRLVFDGPPSLNWHVNQNGRIANVNVLGQAQTINISQLFDRIPKTRLKNAVVTDNGALRLVLNCECQINAFLLNDTIFVLDITDEPASQRLTTIYPKNDDLQSLEINQAASVTLPLIINNTTELEASSHPSVSKRLAAIGHARNSKDEPHIIPDAFIAREQLLKQVSRAASQGLIDAVALENQISSTGERAAISYGKENEESKTSHTTNYYDRFPGQVNLQASSSIDIALSESVANPLEKNANTTCYQDQQFSIRDWSTGQNFQQETGHLISKLYRETDQIDGAAAVSLAKIYIYYGFGAEALFVLSLITEGITDKKALVELAEMLEYGAARDPKAFAQQHTCASSSALWSVLTDKHLLSQHDVNHLSMLKAFDALPRHLRSYLGPILSSRFREAGYSNISSDVMRIVQRGNKNNDSASIMELSQLNIEEGNLEKASVHLSHVISEDAPPSPEALIDLIELKIDQKLGVDANLATLAAAYAFEFRGTELGVSLQRAHVLALADSNQFVKAVEGLGMIAGELLPSKEKEMRSAVFNVIVERAPDDIFLELVLPYFSHPLHTISVEVENRISSRLLDLRISDLVGEMLSDGVQGSLGKDRRILRARLAMLDERPRNALAHLLGIEGEGIDELKAIVYEKLMEFDNAKNIYQELESDQRVSEMAFLSQNWAFLENFSHSSLADLATSRLQISRSDFSSPSLEAGLTALEDSQSSRERIDALLRDFQLNIVPDL